MGYSLHGGLLKNGQVADQIRDVADEILDVADDIQDLPESVLNIMVTDVINLRFHLYEGPVGGLFFALPVRSPVSDNTPDD